MQGALYFPFIRVPDTAWWTRAMLYWDTVATISPGSFIDEPGRHAPYTLDLIRNGLLHQVLPHEAGHRLQGNFERFLLPMSNGEVDRRRNEFQMGNVTEVHVDKWLTYQTGLDLVLEMGLAARDRRNSSWITMESTTAAEFMAALTLALCEEGTRGGWRSSRTTQAESWVPTTDSAPAMRALMSGLTPIPEHLAHEETVHLRVRGEIRAVELRSFLLDDLLPVPEQPVSINTLLDFRRRHGSLLPSFRRFLEAQIDDALAVEDHAARVRLLDRLKEEVLERTEEAQRYLAESGIRRFSRSSILRLFKLVPLLKDTIESAQDLAENTLSNPNFETEPLAYLAFARVQFGANQCYAADHNPGIPLIGAIQ